MPKHFTALVFNCLVCPGLQAGNSQMVEKDKAVFCVCLDMRMESDGQTKVIIIVVL